LTKEIRETIEQRRYEFSKHAVDQSIARNISVREFEQALLKQCEIIEEYPNDKYGPSCLVLTFTPEGRALHVVLTCPDSSSLLKVITLYEPDPVMWDKNRIRKMK
jgi:hypothetical protein